MFGIDEASIRRWMGALLPPKPLPVKMMPNGKMGDALMAETAAEAEARAAKLDFPPDFLVGAATAAYQVEGGLDKCNWAAWERSGRNKGHFAGAACNHWNLFEADVKKMKALGLRMYRFSVDWSRCEPSEGVYDWDVIDRYASWCKLLRSNGIEPMVTLHHFVEPEWFDAIGGWELSENIIHFRRFVEVICKKLASDCKYWCTLNELNGFAMCGWVAGIHPPGTKDDPWLMIKVIKNMLVGHTEATKVIRATHADLAKSANGNGKAGGGMKPIISIAMSHIIFTPSPGYGPLAILSGIVALLVGYLFNFIYWDLLIRGRVPLPFYLLICLLGWRKDCLELKGTVDVLGINHYYRSVVSFEKDDPNRVPGALDLFIRLPLGITLSACPIQNFEKSDMGWDLTPSSMELLLRTMWERYKFPIFVTESGIADGEEPDTRRIRYLSSLLEVAHKLRSDGVDLRGYLFWTLMDNFEWAEGFEPRFGLLHTDFKTFERKERASSAMIKRVLKAGK